MSTLRPEVVKSLGKNIRGSVLVPADNGRYDEARKIWNGMFDRKPAVIVQCADTSDVVNAVNFAREHGLPLSVKGGGHHLAGTSVNDDGMVVDLSRMREVAVDAKSKTARVEGGALLSDLDKASSQHGMAVPAGIVSHTGVGGLTLGGGFGWISRKHGLTIDHLRSAQLVTADGGTVTASETENPDLFWAIRGGGGNFGIATSLEYNCASIGTDVFSGLIVKRFEDAPQFLRFYRDYVRGLPDEMTLWAILRKAPPLPFLPQEHHGKLVIALAFVYLGDPKQGEKLLDPVRKATPSLAEAVGLNPWVGWQSGFDALVPHGARNYWKSHDMPGLTDAVVDGISEYVSRVPSDESQVVLIHMEGATSRVPDDATAYPHRKVPFMVNVEARWHEAKDDEKVIAWAREFDTKIRKDASGVYVNFLSEEGEDRVKEAYTPAAWKRLVDVKKKWDPNNFFHMNQNIRPA
jgi:FAD/FMN-containing dehydrogenase